MTNPIGHVLVTGASKGIGEACAFFLAERDYRVFAGVRKEEDANRLAQHPSGNMVPIILDVTSQEDINGAVRLVSKMLGDGGLDGLVNNAGIAVPGPMEFLSMDDIRHQFEVNLFGQIALTQALFPLLRNARGRVVNMSSVSGKFVYPFFGPYAMSKHALEAFSDALRRELLPWGMHVASVEPGAIATPIWENTLEKTEIRLDYMSSKSDEYYGKVFEKVRKNSIESGKNGLPPLAVAKVVYHALSAKRPKTRYVVGRSANIMVRLSRILPDKLFDRIIKRALFSSR